jgi:hypothetical protein
MAEIVQWLTDRLLLPDKIPKLNGLKLLFLHDSVGWGLGGPAPLTWVSLLWQPAWAQFSST